MMNAAVRADLYRHVGLGSTMQSSADQRIAYVQEHLSRHANFAALVRAQLVDGATSRERPVDCQPPVFLYDVPCTDRNIEMYAYRDDIAYYCAANLRDLLNYDPVVYSSKIYDGLMYTYEGKRISFIGLYTFLWLEAVYSWLSIYFFAMNIYPAMLFPPREFIEKTKGDGEMFFDPKTRSWPKALQEAISGIRAQLQGAGAEQWTNTPATGAREEYWYGPIWKGFYDGDTLVSWVTGDFGVDYSPGSLMHQKRATGRCNDNKYWNYYGPLPSALQSAASYLPLTSSQLKGGTNHPFRENTDYRALFLTYCQSYGSSKAYASDLVDGAYYSCSRSGAIEKRNELRIWPTKIIGPRGCVRIANAWIQTVLALPMMSYAMDSVTWYYYNHIMYFKNKGMIDATIEDIRDMQKNASNTKAKIAKGVVEGIFDVASMVAAATGPWGVLAAAILQIVKYLVGWLVKWIVKRRQKAPQCPWPCLMRSLANPQCTTSGAGTTVGQMATTTLVLTQQEHDEAVYDLETSLTSGGYRLADEPILAPEKYLPEPNTTGLALLALGALGAATVFFVRRGQ